MSEWNFDIASIPRGTYETRARVTTVKGEAKESEYEVFIPAKVWVETKNGQVLISHFNPATKTAPEGWWSMVGQEASIKCWQPFVKPEPSGVSA